MPKNTTFLLDGAQLLPLGVCGGYEKQVLYHGHVSTWIRLRLTVRVTQRHSHKEKRVSDEDKGPGPDTCYSSRLVSLVLIHIWLSCQLM